MANLKKIISKNQKQPLKQRINPEIPTFTAGGGVKKVEKKRKNKGLIIGITVLACVLGFLYIPGFFMSDEENPLIVQTEITTSTALKNTTLRDYPNDDFDGDGISNSDEVNVYGTNPWMIDTDRDGASDAYEIRLANTDPSTADELLSQMQKNIDAETGDNMSTPYRCNNVLLWADNYQSKAYGGVIQTTTGYHFDKFTGHAQFMEGGYAYKYENGVHTLLNYRENENAWEITGSYDVELYTDKLVEYVEINLFGLKYHPQKNFLTTVLDFILPQKGFITARCLTNLDIDTRAGGVYANIQAITYDPADGFRFTKNDTALTNLAYIRSCIEADQCVLVSLYSTSIGEYIGLVYGYDFYGNLLIADKDTLSPIGKLYITEKAVRIVDGSGQLTSIGCFDFKGLGFDSIDGARISFFATVAGKLNNFESLPQRPADEFSEDGISSTDNSSSNGSVDEDSNTVENTETTMDGSDTDEDFPDEIMDERVDWDNMIVIPDPDNGSSENSQTEGDSHTGTGPIKDIPNMEGQSETTPITGSSTEEDIINVLENL